MHAVSWRAGSTAARAALSDEFLSDDLGGRSAGRFVGQPDRTRGFNTYAEWKIGLVCGFVLAAAVVFCLAGSNRLDLERLERAAAALAEFAGALRAGGLLTAALALLEILVLLESDDQGLFGTLEETRNFYGVLTVVKGYRHDPPLPYHMFFSGRIQHGMQYNDPVARGRPRLLRASGIGVTLHFTA